MTVRQATKVGGSRRVSKTEYRRLFENAGVGVLSVASDTGTIVAVNHFLTELLMFSEEEMRGRPLRDLAALDDAHAAGQQIDRLLLQGHLRFYDFPLLTKDGICVRFSFRHAGTTTDNTAVLICTFHDLVPKSRATERTPGTTADSQRERARYRNQFKTDAEQEVERSRRYHRPLSLLSLAIDRRPDDGGGNSQRIADLALQSFAEACAKSMRRSDVVGRVGEGEFVALLPETDGAGARRAADRLRSAMASRQVPSKMGSSRHVTLSVGVVANEGEDVTYESLLLRAGEQLEQARLAGGDCVCP